MFSRKLLLVTVLLTSTAWAANDPFVGQWKFDPSRSKLTDEMKVTEIGQDKYAFDFGGGTPETVVVDGTDQPGIAGSTLSVAAEGPSWKVVRKTGGRVAIRATWTLSKDGGSLIDDFTSFGEDGSPSTVKYVYKRLTGGGSGFAGDWLNTGEMALSVFTLEIRPYESDGLSFVSPGGTTNVTFDGKSARRLNASALQRIESRDGKITQTKRYALSADLKTLTITTQITGHTAPNVFVFERQ